MKILKMQEFKFIFTLQDKLIACGFNYFPNNKIKYASGFVYITISKDRKTVFEKILIDTDGRNPYQVFYQCAKKFLTLKKKFENVKTYDELLNLL